MAGAMLIDPATMQPTIVLMPQRLASFMMRSPSVRPPALSSLMLI
eukprot:CAMPEP_0184466222 /NCGR_PEP_ID=MMETSP0740-20130409/65079_1 /TAXON_ID=385413 /ORGANISM="Thalassiosira miniscula, Strain CCMP1093" /LENGTH=44 /DNA_ID= /DNA_START= /DNA_END= /DNA_ORIENTATION=